MTRVLITGAGGFIGQHVTRRFLAAGADVTAVETPAGLNRVPHGASCTVEAATFRRELSDGGSVDDTVDLVVHLGAITDTTLVDPTPYRIDNVELSQLIVDSCIRDQVPLVYASSAAVYGSSPICAELQEFEAPLNDYGQSKLHVDNYVRGRAAEATAPITGLRFFNVYGPGEDHKGPMASMVHQGAEQIRRTGELRLFGASHGVGDGQHARDFIFVGDVVDVVAWSAEAEAEAGVRLLNCGTGTSRTFADLGQAVIDELGTGAIRYIDFPSHLTDVYQAHTCADVAHLRAAGFAGQFTTLRDGVRATLHSAR